MADGSIEILGQKLAYPTSWHGTATVLTVCVSLVIVAFIAKGWATPEVIDKLKGIANYSEEQDKTTKDLVETVSRLTLQLGELEDKVSKGVATSSNATERNKVKAGQIQRQIELSKLRERLAAQNLSKSATISPLVNPEIDFSQQIQQFQQQQSQQQQIQQNLSSELQQLQAVP
jgi:hypothetical protein